MTQSYSIYLGGPPSFVVHDGVDYIDWRRYLAEEMPGEIGVVYPLHSPGADRQSVNYLNLTKSSIALFNVLGAKSLYLNSCIEIGWAEANRIPVLLLMESMNNPYDQIRLSGHPRASSLDDAVTLVKGLLRPAGPWTPRRSA